MSTRYVWNRYDVDQTTEVTDVERGSTIDTGTPNTCTTYNKESIPDSKSPYICVSVTKPVSNRTYQFDGLDAGDSITVNANEFFMFATTNSVRLGDNFYYYRATKWGYFLCDNAGRDYWWFAGPIEAKAMERITEIIESQGGFLGLTSSANASSYPSDNIRGSYWYTYQGSDNIDPSSCTIPSSILGGQQIQITVTPGTGKVYGGTVSYQYQVNLAGAGWNTISTTTATSVNYTVPAGTASIQVRVRAQDNLGFTSSTYVTSSSVNVVNNQPPTAPGSINVSNVVSGQTATITLTAATDPDGTIASYVYERSVDGSAWTQIANVNSLTQTDTVSGGWGTVAYRACAVDDDGATGPYVTSETTTVNSGWLIISGPANDMGDKPAPFDFEFSINATGATEAVTDIAVTVTLDGETIYTGTPDAGELVSIEMDTRLMRAGEHNIQVAATKEDYLEVSGAYTFDVPFITLPDGGKAEQFQNSAGEVVFPYTLARLVIGKGGKDLNELLESGVKVQTGSYVGTGTYGKSNPTKLTFPTNFEPVLVAIVGFDTGDAPEIGDSPLIFVQGAPLIGYVTGEGKYPIRVNKMGVGVLEWYSLDSASLQSNSPGREYSYVAIGQ